jgi:hypothetical protein
MTQELTNVSFNYVELCQLLDSSTVEYGSPLYIKLRTARDRFRKSPKVYGNGLNIKPSESERIKDQEDAARGLMPKRNIGNVHS